MGYITQNKDHLRKLKGWEHSTHLYLHGKRVEMAFTQLMQEFNEHGPCLGQRLLITIAQEMRGVMVAFHIALQFPQGNPGYHHIIT